MVVVEYVVCVVFREYFKLLNSTSRRIFRKPMKNKVFGYYSGSTIEQRGVLLCLKVVLVVA